MLTKSIDASSLRDTIFSRTHYHKLKTADAEIDAYFKPQNKFEIPKTGLGTELSYNLINNELKLDGQPTLNLASFVNTFASDDAKKLVESNLVKNLADADEYPILMNLTNRNVSILGQLWNGEFTEDKQPMGTATTGSSEAIMLGGLAMKKVWQQKMKAAGKDYYKPNILMGANAQVALEKFARYFDVEARLIPVCEESHHVLDLTKIEENIDENTIGIFVIMGSTYTGGFENVLEVSKILDDIEAKKGFNVPIHVDGASGGFVAPFLFPDLEWDFRVKRVVSINTSGHKFGLTTAGLGWIIWRNEDFLPKELIFQLRYLGSVEDSYTLNFSRPGFQSIHQYYNFLQLGREGYRKIHHSSLRNARLLSTELEKTGYFECVSNIHRKKGSSKFVAGKHEDIEFEDDYYNYGLPVVAFKFRKEFVEQYPNVPQSLVSTLLRNNGWIIPNYPLPPSEESTEILRVVVRYELTDDFLFKLINDIGQVMKTLIKTSEYYIKSLKEEDEIKKNDYIYAVLSLIASGGSEDEELLAKLKNHTETQHTTFKGTC